MNSPANELAEQWEHEELWVIKLSRHAKRLEHAVVEYSGMDLQRALACLDDRREEHGWDLMLERSE